LYGGIANIPSCPAGCGTVFKMTQGGALTTLYSFCSQSGCADGYSPNGALVQAMNGDLYGTTSSGGAHDSGFCPFGCGTIFKITPTGALTTLYNFCSALGCTDGAVPEAGLVQGANGNLYGTTADGGIAKLVMPLRLWDGRQHHAERSADHAI
jgi:uncharacterized repeat protein (TIGR03803 family)